MGTKNSEHKSHNLNLDSAADRDNYFHAKYDAGINSLEQKQPKQTNVDMMLWILQYI